MPVITYSPTLPGLTNTGNVLIPGTIPDEVGNEGNRARLDSPVPMTWYSMLFDPTVVDGLNISRFAVNSIQTSGSIGAQLRSADGTVLVQEDGITTPLLCGPSGTSTSCTGYLVDLTNPTALVPASLWIRAESSTSFITVTYWTGQEYELGDPPQEYELGDPPQYKFWTNKVGQVESDCV